jgi:hypothetical protein
MLEACIGQAEASGGGAEIIHIIQPYQILQPPDRSKGIIGRLKNDIIGNAVVLHHPINKFRPFIQHVFAHNLGFTYF